MSKGIERLNDDLRRKLAADGVPPERLDRAMVQVLTIVIEDAFKQLARRERQLRLLLDALKRRDGPSRPVVH